MKAVAVPEPGRPGKVEYVDIPEPVFGDYECLVRVRACGICSSTDLKIVHGEHPDNPDFPFIYPVILGHEAVGEIVERGKKVSSFKPGDRVVCPLTTNVPECGYRMAYGGMTEYSLAYDYRMMHADGINLSALRFWPEEIDFMTKTFPSDISWEDAVMILTFKENYSALRNFGVREGMDVIIFGDGAVSLGLSRFIRAYKVNSVVIAGHHDDRLERIRRLTEPDLLINTAREDLRDALGDRRFDIAVDAAGSLDIVREGAALLKPGGKVCVYGVFGKGKSTLDLYELPNNTGIQIMPYPYREHRTHDDIIAMMQSGFINAKDHYSHVLPAEQAAEGIRLIETREAFKVILTF
jgi:threonine dehydrogenase-like Zn-dependent dehydrogenase